MRHHVYPGGGHGLFASEHGRVNSDLISFIRQSVVHVLSRNAPSSSVVDALLASAGLNRDPCRRAMTDSLRRIVTLELSRRGVEHERHGVEHERCPIELESR